MKLLQKGIFRYLRNERGDGGLLITAFIACVIIAVAAASVTQTMSGFFSGISAGQLAQKAFWLAEARAKEINVTPYANITAVAEARINLTGYNFDREVVVGNEVDLGGGNTKRDILVNIYVPGEPLPRVSLPVVATSASTGGTQPHGAASWEQPGTFSWTAPAGVSSVTVTLVAGGGGGGACGTSGMGLGRHGQPGGNSTFGTLLTAVGGGGGTSGYNDGYTINSGSNGASTEYPAAAQGNTRWNYGWAGSSSITGYTGPSFVYGLGGTATGYGGGGGASGFTYMGRAVIGGGGGAGQVIYKQMVTVTPGQTYQIVVGAGGAYGYWSGGGQPTMYGGNGTGGQAVLEW